MTLDSYGIKTKNATYINILFFIQKIWMDSPCGIAFAL